MTTKPNKPLRDLSAKEILDRDMSLAAYGSAGVARSKGKINPRHSARAKNDPVWLARLAAVREGTQIGGPRMRRCTRISKGTGEPCRNPAVRGEDCCHQHLDAKGIIRLRARRAAEGRPVEKAHVLARRNLRALLRHSKIPLELLREPIFQAVMKLVAPKWFGAGSERITDRFERRKMGDAALLSREMVLAWMTGTDTGDWSAWWTAVGKVHAGGYQIPPKRW